MPTIYELKQSFQNLLRPVTRVLAANGISANQVTVAALLLSLSSAAWIFFSQGSTAALLALPAVLFVRMALNAIDGMLAREHNMQSNLGAILNELGDVVSDTAIYLSFAAVAGVPAMPLVIVAVLAVISEMTGVVAVQIGGGRRYDGPMGKSDRAFVFAVLALMLGLNMPLESLLAAALWIVAAMIAVTILNRASRALHESKDEKSP
jgi:CDP-diacylglycerol--glycerol-3-phosphate 3-phosphatidyltransferase